MNSAGLVREVQKRLARAERRLVVSALAGNMAEVSRRKRQALNEVNVAQYLCVADDLLVQFDGDPCPVREARVLSIRPDWIWLSVEGRDAGYSTSAFVLDVVSGRIRSLA